MSSCGRKSRKCQSDGTTVYDNDGNTYQDGWINVSLLNGNFSGAFVH